MKITKGFLGPDVETAFVREARGEFGDHKRRGDEKNYRGEDPEADGGGAVVGGGGDPTGAEDRGDVEEQDVPKAHFFAELFDRVGRGVGVCF